MMMVMRRLGRVALLCLGCGVCSLLYGFSQLALSLEQEPGGRQRDPAAAGRSGGAGRYGTGTGLGAAPPAGLPGRSRGRRGRAPLRADKGKGPGGRGLAGGGRLGLVPPMQSARGGGLPGSEAGAGDFERSPSTLIGDVYGGIINEGTR